MSIFRGFAVLGALCMLGASVAGAQTPFDAAAAFGAREAVSDVSLSPDGKLISLVQARPGGGSAVAVVPVAGGEPVVVLNGRADQRLRRCSWSGAQRLVCTVSATVFDGTTRYSLSRMFAVNADGSKLQQLSSRQSDRALGLAQGGGSIVDLLPDETGSSVLMARTVVPDNRTETRVGETKSGYAVERLDTATLERRIVEPARPNAVEYISDGHGTVRIIGERERRSNGYVAAEVTYCYRLPDSRDCRPLSVVGGDGSGFDPHAVDRDLNVAYGFDKHQGRTALFKVALDGTLKRELVLANPSVDIDGLLRIGGQRRVVGASYATERRQAVIFDPALRKLAASLAKALPDLPQVSIVDASTDESKLLIVAASDNHPGRYYLYDKQTRELNELLNVRPPLDGIKLATVKPVSFPAADGTMVPGYLTLPPGSTGRNLPAIVMPHGGPGARDEWGFDWWAQFFANRGYAVLQPNFRGSTGYGDGWFRDNGFKSWRLAVGDINDGGRWLAAQGIAAPDKLAIVGWSYGGYAALQSAVLDPALFKAIIAVAPVTDLETLREDARNFTNFPIVDAFIGRGPHIREGSPAQNAGRIKAPVLMFHGDRDLNVAFRQAQLMEGRLAAAGNRAELVRYPGLDHQLDDETARPDMLRRSDAFLRKALGL